MPHYPIIEQGQPIKQASKALILLHGRGGTAADILRLANEVCDDRFYIVAPQAPNGTWYPHSFMAKESTNEPWLSSSVQAIKELIDATAKSIPLDQIYLMGFSQGACLALETSTRFAAKYGGVAAFTGGLIGHTLNEHKYHGDFAGTQVFIGTSDQDPHVPLMRSEESKQLMERMGAHVTLKVYQGMGHTINEDEIQWVKRWMISF